MRCFDCSECMVLQHTLQEGARIYEWFECPNCRAQYLELKSTDAGVEALSESTPAADTWPSTQAISAPA